MWLYLPTTQFAQVVSAVAPIAAEYVPAGQSKQELKAVVSAKEPAGQLVHSATLVLLANFPCTQSMQAVYPGRDRLPTGQAEQTALERAPGMLENEPAGHASQTFLPSSAP